MSPAVHECPHCGLVYMEIERAPADDSGWWGTCPRCRSLRDDLKLVAEVPEP